MNLVMRRHSFRYIIRRFSVEAYVMDWGEDVIHNTDPAEYMEIVELLASLF